ncbi:seqA protein [Candidatus Photodesmus blepharus]|uniref:Negative modulator of initiation of replication n=1 Tax=Candidatus Photodesmus blepharonis TaxID=1179155 RepID=A0A084CN30_9GAMM|nr:replication initiation negative regulator SeqA [Candidatus Photodesmus blepharus]KEY91209.1 seqA protein [Candidatus Photodesmus blepharus]
MKIIEVDEDLYHYIAAQTKHIGESASDILRRLLSVDGNLMDSIELIEPTKQDTTANEDEKQNIQLIVGVKEIRSLLISDEFIRSKKAIDRFMLVLSRLYHINPESFAEAAQVKGRTRVYFADNEKILLAHGNTTKPKVIPNTHFWVITNNNTSRKRQMVEQLMMKMSFPLGLIRKVSNAI